MTTHQQNCLLIWMICIICVLFTTVYSDISVSIRSKYGQPVTSSTLQWTSGESGSRPEKAVEGGNENGVTYYVCRASYSGLWLPGRLNESLCQAAFVSEIRYYVHYDTLENVDESARLQWVPWDRYSTLPNGAIEAGGNYIARHVDDTGDIFLGMLDTSDGMGKIKVYTGHHGLREYNSGEVLVEIEPNRYDLKTIKFNRKRAHIKQEPLLLGKAILMNKEDEPMKAETVLAYDNEYQMYWGQGKAILKGLPTDIHLPNSTKLEIKWGIPDIESNKVTIEASAMLGANTAVNVSLVANRTVTDMSYKTHLVARYEDGDTKSREIHGNRREVMLTDIKLEYGPAYFIANGSFVPTTTTTTTSTTSTTTSTTIRTTTETLKPIMPKLIDSVSDEPSGYYDHESTSKNGMQSDESAWKTAESKPISVSLDDSHSNSVITRLDRWLLFILLIPTLCRFQF